MGSVAYQKFQILQYCAGMKKTNSNYEVIIIMRIQ